jgi:serine/threonine protein kinase
MPPDAPDGPRKAVRIGKYQILQHVATGGMASVYKARDVRLKREVALKVLSPETAAKPAMLQRFRSEAHNAAKLEHENVVQIYEFNEADGVHFLAMEFVHGVDLHEYIDRKGKLDPDEAREIVVQAARALERAHQLGVVHRDVKPSNFLLSRSRKGHLLVKLSDFGLSREVDDDDRRVTRTGTTVGTVDYIAPEQARNSRAADVRSDLYSLGCTWFHMLAGHAPFPEGAVAERLYRHMHEPPPDLRAINERVSEATAAVLGRLMAKDPADRCQTPSALLAELDDLEGGPPMAAPDAVSERALPRGFLFSPVETPPEQATESRGRWAGPRVFWIALAVLAVLLLGASGVAVGLLLKSMPPR